MSVSIQEIDPETLGETQETGLKTQDREPVLFSVHTDFSSVEAIWRQFEETADCFAFQTFDFLATWYTEIGCRSSIDVQIVVAWGLDAVPIMILPLGIEKSGFARKLTWLGNDVSDYNAPLLSPSFSRHVSSGQFAAIWPDIVSLLPPHDWVEMLRQPDLVNEQANPLLELPTQLNASGAHMTKLGEDFEAYYQAKRNSKARSHLRNRRKKLEALGETLFVHPRTKEEVTASIDKLVRLKTASLSAMGAPNFLKKPGHEAFYKSLASNQIGEGLVYVSHLQVGGDYVAGVWGLVHKKRFYYLLASYDGPTYGRFKPGVQALVETMRWATDQGIEIFDFTVGDESYKDKWCEIHIDLHDHLAAQNVRGSLALLETKLFLALKRKIKQTPLFWTTFTRLRARFLGS